MDARDKTQCRKKQLDYGRGVTGTSSIERSPLGRLYGKVPYDDDDGGGSFHQWLTRSVPAPGKSARKSAG
jgi:hypothetical protein